MYLKLDRISTVPFDPALKVKFALKMKSFVKIFVSDFFGKEIGTIVNRNHEPGEYEAEFSGYHLPSGSYSFTMETEYSVENKKSGNHKRQAELSGEIFINRGSELKILLYN